MLMRGFGLLIESQIDIPGCVPAVENAAEPSIRVTQGFCDIPSGKPLYRIEGEAIIFAPPDVGEFRITQNGVDMQLRGDADKAYATALLIATALPALLWKRGQFMLHAAGVQLRGEAGVTAIAGPSGSGKSTIVQKLLTAGATLVGDDSLCLTLVDDAILASGLSGGIHLRGNGERVFQPQARRTMEQTPLRRAVILGHRNDVESVILVNGIEAVELLLQNAHRPKVPALLGQQSANVSITTAIARTIPVLKWIRREGDLAIDPSYFRDMVTENIPGGQK